MKKSEAKRKMGNKLKKKDKDNKKISVKTINATVIMVFLAVIIVFLGYSFLAARYDYTKDDLIEGIVGNLIGVLASYAFFDILYNKLTQDDYTRETSQQITKTLMGTPEILDSFETEDRMTFINSTVESLVKDSDVADMATSNLDRLLYPKRIRKSFDYTIQLRSSLPNKFVSNKFPNPELYYYVDERIKFNVKYLSKDGTHLHNKNGKVSIGFSFDKKCLDGGLLETKDDDFKECIFNEELAIKQEVINIFKDMADKKDGSLDEYINELFVPVLRIDNNEADEEAISCDVIFIENSGLILEFSPDYNENQMEHDVSIFFKMPRLWGSPIEVTLVDPTKEPSINLSYDIDGGMEVDMYSYLNKENMTNSGACIGKTGLYDIAIKEEWILPKSGVIFNVKKKEKM